jgi:glutathione S-transferase
MLSMKLISSDLSPFAVRVRAAIYAKGLDIEIVGPPAAGIKSPEYLAMNPMCRIPVLVLDDGSTLPESETIVEFLEDTFPEKPLRPASAKERAQARLVSRVAELYVMGSSTPLFSQMDPSTRDQAVVDATAAKIKEGVGHLNAVMGDGPYAAGPKFTTADCWLIPQLFMLNVMQAMFGLGDLLADAPKVKAYAEVMKNNPVAQKVTAQQQAGLEAMQAGG